MSRLHRVLLLWLTLAALIASPLLGQKDGPKFMLPIPDKYDRPTKDDANGVAQWVDFKAEPCVNCKGSKVMDCLHCARLDDSKKCIECQGKKKATCRACGGLGTYPDPLEKVLCPGCLGAAFFPCTTCGGRGGSKVEGSGDKVMACPSCKGDGGFKCAVCGGARLVESVQLKPGLKDNTNLAMLQKARDQVDAALKDLAGFEPDGKNTRKDVKDIQKRVGSAPTAMTPLKKWPKALDDVMGKIYGGSGYMGHEEREAETLKLWKSNTEYYLKHQKRILEICIARAEHNQKAAEKAAEKKDE
jgi:hypothetical protein